MPTPAELDHIIKSPAMKLPPGETLNLINPPQYGYPEWILSTALCIIFTTPCVLMRLYTKLVLIKNHGIEDCTSFLLEHPILVLTEG